MGVDLLVVDLWRKRHTETAQSWRAGWECALGKGTSGELGVLRDTSASPQAGRLGLPCPGLSHPEPSGPGSQSATSRRSSKEPGKLSATGSERLLGCWLICLGDFANHLSLEGIGAPVSFWKNRKTKHTKQKPKRQSNDRGQYGRSFCPGALS